MVEPRKLTPTKPTSGEPDGYSFIIEPCDRSGEQIKCEGKAKNLTDAIARFLLHESHAVDDEGNIIGIWMTGGQPMFAGTNSASDSNDRLLTGVSTGFVATINDFHRNVQTINMELHTHWKGGNRYDALVFDGVPVQ